MRFFMDIHLKEDDTQSRFCKHRGQSQRGKKHLDESVGGRTHQHCYV